MNKKLQKNKQTLETGYHLNWSLKGIAIVYIIKLKTVFQWTNIANDNIDIQSE